MIINLYEGRVISIDDELSELLQRCEQGEPLYVINEKLDKLLEMGWANEYDKPVFIDKIRVTNVFGKRHMWKAAPVINLAVLQITGECDRKCENCFDDRCPSCKQSISDSNIGLDGWMKVIDRLALYSTEAVLVTGGNPILNPDYEKIMDYAMSKGMRAVIHVPSAGACRKIKNKYGILFSAISDEDILHIGKLLSEKSNILRVFVSEKKRNFVHTKDKRISFVNIDNLRINKSNMFSLGIDPYRFVLKQMYNECFWGKICINSVGEVLPCLGATNAIGSFLENDFAMTFKRLMEEYWYISVDDRGRDNKCQHCENRYVCRNLCIFSSDKKQCAYNVEELKWS